MNTLSEKTDSKQQKLNELFELGKTKGFLTYDEVIDRLSSLEVDPEQFENVLQSLADKGITVKKGTEEAGQDTAVPEVLPEFDDRVKIYEV